MAAETDDGEAGVADEDSDEETIVGDFRFMPTTVSMELLQELDESCLVGTESDTFEVESVDVEGGELFDILGTIRGGGGDGRPGREEEIRGLKDEPLVSGTGDGDAGEISLSSLMSQSTTSRRLLLLSLLVLSSSSSSSINAAATAAAAAEGYFLLDESKDIEDFLNLLISKKIIRKYKDGKKRQRKEEESIKELDLLLESESLQTKKIAFLCRFTG